MMFQKSSILSHVRPMIARFRQHPRLFLGFSAVSLLGVATAIAFVPDPDALPLQPNLIVEALAPAVTVVDVKNIDDSAHLFLSEERIQRSDTLGTLLARLGVRERAAIDFLRQSPDAQAIARQLRPGKVVTARTTQSGELDQLYFPLNGKDAALIVKRNPDGAEGFSVSKENIAFDTQTLFKSGEITSSLFAATDAADIPDGIAAQLIDIFSGEIDFHRDLHKGDRFSIVYEMSYLRGEPVRSGRILAAEFTSQQKTYTAFFNAGSGGQGSYYNAEGQSLRKAFLRSPLEFSRITSGFTGARYHPILKEWRSHKGIDYAAPTGARVKAISDGTVAFIGRQNGYGNLIVLKHQGNYSSAYGHLNGFAEHLKRGDRVGQGDIIGYVGQTGLATGPHLHYEFRINDQQVNPLAVNLPVSIPLDGKQLTAFKSQLKPSLIQLSLAREAKPVAFQ